MPPVSKNIKNINTVNLMYSQWLFHKDMIVDGINIIRELVVPKKYTSINSLTMCNLDFMIEIMYINLLKYNSSKTCFIP